MIFLIWSSTFNVILVSQSILQLLSKFSKWVTRAEGPGVHSNITEYRPTYVTKKQTNKQINKQTNKTKQNKTKTTHVKRVLFQCQKGCKKQYFFEENGTFDIFHSKRVPFCVGPIVYYL